MGNGDRYTGPAHLELRACGRIISGQEMVVWFADGQGLYYCGFNHRVAKCAVRKITKKFKAPELELEEVENKNCPEELGKD